MLFSTEERSRIIRAKQGRSKVMLDDFVYYKCCVDKLVIEIIRHFVRLISPILSIFNR